MRSIYNDTHIECLVSDQLSDTIVLCFGHMHSRPEPDRFWGHSLLRNMGYSSIGITPKSANWFPMCSMSAAAESIIQAVSGYRRIFSYGYSMGAYAALKYGNLLHSQLAIAFAPQISISPEDVSEFDRRYSKYYMSGTHDGMIINSIDLPKRAFLFYDPFDKSDVAHALKISKLDCNVNLIKVPAGGHDCIRPFARTHLSTSMFDICTSGLVSDLYALSHQARREYSGRLYNSLRVLADRRPYAAIEYFPGLLSRFPTTHASKLWASVAITLMHRKDKTHAMEACDMALEFEPSNDKILGLREMIGRIK